MFLYNGEKCLGCLAVEESSLLSSTKSAASLTSDDIIGHALLGHRKSGREYTFCRMELFHANTSAVEQKPDVPQDDSDDIVLLFAGTRTVCPGKTDLMKRLLNGEEVEVEVRRDCAEIIVSDNMGRLSGKLLEISSLISSTVSLVITMFVGFVPSNIRATHLSG